MQPERRFDDLPEFFPRKNFISASKMAPAGKKLRKGCRDKRAQQDMQADEGSLMTFSYSEARPLECA